MPVPWCFLVIELEIRFMTEILHIIQDLYRRDLGKCSCI